MITALGKYHEREPTTNHPLVWSMPSAMKSPGKPSSNSLFFSKG